MHQVAFTVAASLGLADKKQFSSLWSASAVSFTYFNDFFCIVLPSLVQLEDVSFIGRCHAYQNGSGVESIMHNLL